MSAEELHETISLMQTHAWDRPTMFCTRCGASIVAVYEGRRDGCTASPNVIGMSHLRSRQRLALLSGE